MSVSALVKDLTNLPNIISQLGLSIAAAQKAFNLDYLEAMGNYLEGAIESLKDDPAAKDKMETLIALLKEVGPSRYQFSETELEFRADLSKSLQLSAGLAVGGAIGAVAINASVAVGYAYDYRAAARIKTVLHAIPASADVMNRVLGRLKELDATNVQLPERAKVDEEIIGTLKELVKLLPPDKPSE